MTTPKFYSEYPLTIKYIERNSEGNSLLLLINDTAAPVSQGGRHNSNRGHHDER